MNKLFSIFITISLFYYAKANIDIDTNQIYSGLIGKFPMVSDLQSQLGQNFSVEDVKKVFREKCFNVTKKLNYYDDEIEKNAMDVFTCVQEHFNITAIQEEMEIAKPQGELDTVFNKYCKKREPAMKCITDFTTKVQGCLNKEENDLFDMMMKIINRLLDFVCYKGGDYIALFIAEKGPECLQQSIEPIQACVNDTFNSIAPDTTDFNLNDLKSIASLPTLTMGDKECKEVDDFEACVVKTLTKCEEITPANIVESMFKYIKKETKCPAKKA